MRKRTAAAALVGVALVATPAAEANATEVTVRIEGRTQTLFERPLLAEGADVQAASDTTQRTCDGINPNDPQNVAPGATPTAAAVEAMDAIGETFDGRWFAGFDDYLITRWGPDREGSGESWSVFVNDALLDVGGCQYELHAGAEVLWSLAPPGHEPLLALYPDATSAGAPPLTAQAQLGEPFTVSVDAYHDGAESEPPQAPERTGSTPFAGAVVAPVQTAVNGFETIDGESAEAVRTDAQGQATIVFATPGWHRLKASAEGAIRSNRLDVCVPAPGASGCGQPPADDLATAGTSGEREGTPEDTGGGTQEPKSSSEGSGGGSGSQAGSSSGQSQASAGATAAYSLSDGAQPSRTLRVGGLTLTPLDDRSPALHLAGPWRRVAEAAAWRGTLTVGSRGAMLSVRLGRGRPAFIVRRVRHAARVEIVAGAHSRIVQIAGSRGGASRVLVGAVRSRPGVVRLRVLDGSVGIDGVAVVG
jgi:hypothetical protein